VGLADLELHDVEQFPSIENAGQIVRFRQLLEFLLEMRVGWDKR
jgi:hypothetical protein